MRKEEGQVSLVVTEAILLRNHPYSETSRVLRFYSEELGLVSLLARGVRRKEAREGGGLSVFAGGLLTLHHREARELQILREFLPRAPRRGLALDPLRLAGASVLGELVLQQAGEVRNPLFFASFARALDALEATPAQELLPGFLAELWSMVRELGYGPELEGCVECGRPLGEAEMGRFHFPAGGLCCEACGRKLHGPRVGPQARAQLRSLLDRAPPPELRRPRAHLRLASDFITYHISGGTPLRSLGTLATLLSHRHA